MAAASSKSKRSSCLHFLISFSSFILFLLSAASLAPTLALKTPPSYLGYAFLLISSISIISSLIGIFHSCTYTTHIYLLLASSAAQFLAFLALFFEEKTSLSMFRSPRDPREAKLLVRVECVLFMATFVMQSGVLLLCHAAHRREKAAQ